MIDNIFVANPEMLSDSTIKEYLGLEDIKSQELLTLNRFCQILKQQTFYHHIFENYYLNYQIPQIGKEFDLLRIGDELIINIELKSEKIDDEEILKQLERNYYYLSFLKREICCYTFVTDGSNDILYRYNKEDTTIELITDLNELIKVMSSIKNDDKSNIDTLFVPSNYLVSPFNSTEQFIKGEYFLTKQQEQIKKDILKKIDQNNPNKIFSLSGAAGTGKTLLTYDIVNTLQKLGKKVTIIHCAQANNGIYQLTSKYKWHIITVKYYSPNSLSSDILIFDESQRISKKQLETILINEPKFILFSHDINQKLNKTNQAEVVVKEIETIADKNKFTLTTKIRHNKNLASFLKKFYDLSKIKLDGISKNDYNNISFYFTKNINDAEKYINHLKSLGWEHIYLTTSMYNLEPLHKVQFSSSNSSHQVIGQEYDNVVIAINSNFYYGENQKLSYNARYYYNPLETLFQAITRTKQKLTFVIIDNEEIYKSCMKIVNGG